MNNRLNSRGLSWVFAELSHACGRVCVCELELTHFPRGPSGNRREWPLQTRPRHPPFPARSRRTERKKKKRWRKLNHKTLLASFYYAACATCTATGGVMSPPRGTKQRSRNGNPMCYLSENHTNIDVAARAAGRQRRANSCRLFPFIALQSCGDVYTFEALYGLANILWGFLKMCAHVSVCV